MSDSKVEIKIPDQLVQSLVMAEVGKQLGGVETILDKIVQTILTSTIRGDYSSNYRDETFVVRAARKAVEDEAQRACLAWVEANREKIHKAVLTSLDKQRAALAKSLVDALANGVKFNVDVRLTGEP